MTSTTNGKATPGRVSGFFKTLSDPTRLGILGLLFDQGERCVCELMTALDISQPKASRHLGVLRRHQLILTRRSGTWIYYRLDPGLPAWQREVLKAYLKNSVISSTILRHPVPGGNCCATRGRSIKTGPAPF